MEIIKIDKDNIEKEHICCAISSNHDIQVESKKAWLSHEFDNGLVFKKMNIRGKCFIEYIPLENAWVNITGDCLVYINCLWVSGKYQGHGYAKELLENCIEDCLRQKRKGIVIISSRKKSPFVMDYRFLKKFGFCEVDQWNDYVLMFRSLDDHVDMPKFQIAPIKDNDLILYYSHQCPFNVKYVNLLKEYCDNQHIPLKCVHLQTSEEAKKAPTPLTTYSLFYQKQFITREVLNAKKFQKIWETLHE